MALINGEVHLDDDADPAGDPTLVLRVATAAARLGCRIDRDSLDRLGRFSRTWPSPWPAGASDDLVGLLLEGERAIPVWEALEQRDLVSRVIPEWSAVRCRPQRNAFHRFTVDRHLWQAAANAAALAAQGGAQVIPQAQLSTDRIASLLTEAMEGPDRLATMASAAKSTGKPDAAGLLADLVEAIAAGKGIAQSKGATQ